jgi:hypothetical protein
VASPFSSSLEPTDRTVAVGPPMAGRTVDVDVLCCCADPLGACSVHVTAKPGSHLGARLTRDRLNTCNSTVFDLRTSVAWSRRDVVWLPEYTLHEINIF